MDVAIEGPLEWRDDTEGCDGRLGAPFASEIDGLVRGRWPGVVVAVVALGAVVEDSEKGGDGGVVATSEAMDEATDFDGGVAAVGEDAAVVGERSAWLLDRC